MVNDRTYYNSDLLSEKEKSSFEYLKGMTNSIISELLYEKTDLRMAYDYYNQIRSKDAFRFIEENFGMQTPTELEFTPLTRRHIDMLVGERLSNKIKPKITCKDRSTLEKMENEKTQYINELFRSYTKKNAINSINKAERGVSSKLYDEHQEDDKLRNLLDEIEGNFISQFEITAQNLLTYFEQDKDTDLQNKLRIMFTNLLISGSCFYRVKTNRLNELPELEVLNPLDVFYRKNTNTTYINDCNKIMFRKYMTRTEILNEYGHLMTEEDREIISRRSFTTANYEGLYHTPTEEGFPAIAYSNTADYNNQGRTFLLSDDVLTVYHVEWIANNKYKLTDEEKELAEVVEGPGKVGNYGYRLDRYETLRIGQDMYIYLGKSKHVVRSADRPYECKLSVNGLSYADYNGKPYSLILATKMLQDRYDLLHFMRDTVIANSGVKGDFLDVSMLPTFLGSKPVERLKKWKAYKKAGIALINSAQAGRMTNGSAPLNTIFQGYDDSVNLNAIQAIQMAIQLTEQTCSAITGVDMARLGEIEQREAVSNVKASMNQSAIITKQHFTMMDLMTKHLLTDMINAARVTLKNGFKGSYIVGRQRQLIFNVMPEHFSFTDYDIHVSDDGSIIKEMETIQALTMELAKSGAVEIDTVLQMISSESLTDMKTEVLKSYNKKKKENDMVNQLTQQMQQAQQQMQQMEQQLQKLQQENESLKKKDIDFEKEKFNKAHEIDKERLDKEFTFKERELKLKEDHVKAEVLQLYDTNKQNDEIKNV